MDSIYFRDPNGQLLELACYKFVAPEGYTIPDVLAEAHRIRVEAGDYNVQDKHLAQAIEEMSQARRSIQPTQPSEPTREQATAGS